VVKNLLPQNTSIQRKIALIQALRECDSLVKTARTPQFRILTQPQKSERSTSSHLLFSGVCVATVRMWLAWALPPPPLGDSFRR
jgi:hypothetical protein